MELPPETTTDEIVMDTLGTRSAKRKRIVLPWVPVVLCAVVLIGMLVYEVLQVRRLQAALEAAQWQANQAAEVEKKLAQTLQLLDRMGDAVKATANQAAAAKTAETDRIQELEKLTLFLRDELKAATKTIDDLKSANAAPTPPRPKILTNQ